MERTPEGTPVGVDDPYAVAGRCDHLTDDGRCRYALDHAGNDPAFAADRREDEYRCHVGADGEWRRCPHYRWTTDGRACRRCGLEERRIAHDSARSLIEEHHLSYGSNAAVSSGSNTAVSSGSNVPDGDDAEGDGTAEPTHELTVALCRWCHAKVHNAIARIDDDVSPDPEAIAEFETRRAKEIRELEFSTARDRSDE